MSLSVLDDTRVFPPKMFHLVVWFATFLFALAGLFFSPLFGTSFWIWVVIAAVGIRQIWVMKWVRLDSKGIGTRNIVGVSKWLAWNEIANVNDREIPVRKERSFDVLTVSGRSGGTGKNLSIVVDSDTVGYDVLREILLNALPESVVVVKR